MQASAPPFKACPDSLALRSMFEARKRVFVDILKWDVPVVEGAYEIDQFDTGDATYLILTDDHVKHRASARILRTDRPHILRDLFPYLCDGPLPACQTYREITRFCIEPTLGREDRRLVRNELVTALADYAITNGLAGYTAVANQAWFDQIATFGWRCSSLGSVCRVNGENLVALRIDINAETLADLKRGGIYRSGEFSAVRLEREFAS